jgi:Fe2+ or Zn2+ uptake regulation protein
MADSRRNTVQRRLILNAVKELDNHATAEQVYAHIVRSHPSISKATVYRNLGQMSETGELLNIGSFFGVTRYDHNRHEHYHFICESCKQVFDVEGDFSDVIGRTKGNDRFDIARCHLTFSGLCRDCHSPPGL